MSTNYQTAVPETSNSVSAPMKTAESDYHPTPLETGVPASETPQEVSSKLTQLLDKPVNSTGGASVEDCQQAESLPATGYSKEANKDLVVEEDSTEEEKFVKDCPKTTNDERKPN